MKHLSKKTFLVKFQEYRGLIPIAIDDRKIVWLDMDTYHFYEGFFHKSLEIYQALKHKTEIAVFSTSINILRDETLFSNYVYPTGFIFHSGRCGSTLLAKVLARSKNNLVISEASPHNSIWQFFTKNGQQPLKATQKNKTIYRNLIFAMGRQRLLSYENYFIKFTSFNIHFFDFIHEVFPDVPAVFLTRNISDILASYHENMPEWFKTNQEGFNALTEIVKGDLKQVVESFFKKANAKPDTILKQIDYELLKPENLKLILSYLNTEPNESQLELMKAQFLFNSKIELNKSIFKKV